MQSALKVYDENDLKEVTEKHHVLLWESFANTIGSICVILHALQWRESSINLLNSLTNGLFSTTHKYMTIIRIKLVTELIKSYTTTSDSVKKVKKDVNISGCWTTNDCVSAHLFRNSITDME